MIGRNHGARFAFVLGTAALVGVLLLILGMRSWLPPHRGIYVSGVVVVAENARLVVRDARGAETIVFIDEATDMKLGKTAKESMIGTFVIVTGIPTEGGIEARVVRTLETGGKPKPLQDSR